MNIFPIPLPNDADAFADYEQLTLFNGASLIKTGEWFSRSEFDTSKQKPIYIDQNNVGLKASDRHHWYARMACDSLNSPSPIRSWYQDKHRATLENSKFYEINPRSAIALRKYIASQFRPTAALAIYQMFDAKRVYDPCGGWGDRLVAAMALGIDYHCRDTNPLVIAADAAMQQFYKTTGNISFEYAQSELSPPNGEFDLAFTSPPYWKAEKYQGNLSSHNLYKKFDDWLENFLFKMLDHSFSSLIENGHLVINISDMYGNHTYNRIVQPILEKYKDYETYVIGYRMTKRINSKSNNTGVFCEPIIVVKK